MWIVGRGWRRRRRRIVNSNLNRNISRTNPDRMDNSCTVIQTVIRTLSSSRSLYNSSPNCYIMMVMVLMTAAVHSSEIASRASIGTGRSIRHLPCVSRRTGETGLCMFAYSCAKANGTHLGTCIDRFYFGSCCKVSSSDSNLVDPISHNYLNKDDTSFTMSSMKTPYQRPSSAVVTDFSVNTSSTMSLPVSVSTAPHPLSMTPSSLATDFFTSVFMKPSGSSKPSSIHTTSMSYDTLPITSRTPIVNVTFSQSYSTPASSPVTTSPLVYSTTVASLFQTAATHKPTSGFQTTVYSKPVTKPISKLPYKPKPTTTGKPGGSIKPKPTKTPSKPAIITQSTYSSSVYSSSSTQTPFSSPYNKTTLQSTFTNAQYSSIPSIYTTESSGTTRISTRPSLQEVPTPITLFTSNKKTSKPTRPTIYSTTSLPPTSIFVKVPTSDQSQPSQMRPLQQTQMTSSTNYVSATFGPSSSVTFEQNFKFNNTVETEEDTEKPTKPWMISSTFSSVAPSSTSYSTRPWTMPTTSSTASQPALVTWTTIEEIPGGLIMPDRTKPTSIIKPSGKPTMTKPAIIPTYTKPLASSTGRPGSTKPFMKPASSLRPEVEENYRPTMTVMSSSSANTGSTSPGWVEVSVSTHAPTSSPPSIPAESSEEITMAVITQTSSKPMTSVIIPVVSPPSVELTQPPALETNEIESPGINMSDYRDVCGRRLLPTARIVGGSKSSFGKWPWQISLRQWRTSTYLHKCGAALFNENWAVTAAHCVENVPPSDLLLRLGEHDLSVEDEPYGYQERRVQIVASHPQFDPRTFEYDLALLRFYEPVKFQPNIIPVCVPEDDTNFVGTEAFVTGWGRLYEDGPLPSMLQEVSVPVINNSVCENMYQSAGYIEHIPNIFICAGWRKGGFDSCEGDSGGPMVIQRSDKRWLLAGIISWGIGCAEPNQPGVYTRISEFRDWINQILQF